ATRGATSPSNSERSAGLHACLAAHRPPADGGVDDAAVLRRPGITGRTRSSVRLVVSRCCCPPSSSILSTLYSPSRRYFTWAIRYERPGFVTRSSQAPWAVSSVVSVPPETNVTCGHDAIAARPPAPNRDSPA